MKIILGNPGSGKTKELLSLSSEKRIPILCESEARVQRLLIKAQGYGYTIPSPVTLNQLTDTIQTVLVDDIQRLFEVALKVKVEILTVNRDATVEVIDLDKK